MTPEPLDRAAARSLERFTAEIDEIAATQNTTRAEILRNVIEGLEERIAEDTAILALARRLKTDDRRPAETALETAIDIVAQGGGQRPWRGK